MSEPRVRNGSRGTVTLVVPLAIGLMTSAHAQQQQKVKPQVNMVSVVGCVARGDNAWMLTNATEPKITRDTMTMEKDLEAARSERLGKNRYRLIGTAEFGPPEELLGNAVRAQVTTKGSENATAVLQNGRKVIVKGLLIDAPNEKRLNLTSVRALSDSCK